MTSTRYKVLVVDDEEPMVEIVEAMVARFGHETIHAYSGNQAVAVARESHPDAVVTGIMMAGGDGISAAKQILEILPACKIVFASAVLFDEEVRRFLIAEGFDERIMLRKPFDVTQLADALTRAGIPSVSPKA